MQSIKARVGTWYEDLQSATQFKVVAFDDAAQTVEIQMLDGEICEYDLDSWHEMQLQSIEEPEDWRNAFELVDEDGRDPDRSYRPDCDFNPVDEIEPDIINGLDDDF